MECMCFSDCVDDSVKVLFEGQVTTWFGHKCFECGKTIKSGEIHLFEKTVFEGRFESYRTCLDCYSVREQLVCEFFYGDLWGLVRNEIFDRGDYQPWAKIGRLTPVARDKVCEMIERDWNE